MNSNTCSVCNQEFECVEELQCHSIIHTSDPSKSELKEYVNEWDSCQSFRCIKLDNETLSYYHIEIILQLPLLSSLIFNNCTIIGGDDKSKNRLKQAMRHACRLKNIEFNNCELDPQEPRFYGGNVNQLPHTMQLFLIQPEASITINNTEISLIRCDLNTDFKEIKIQETCINICFVLDLISLPNVESIDIIDCQIDNRLEFSTIKVKNAVLDSKVRYDQNVVARSKLHHFGFRGTEFNQYALDFIFLFAQFRNASTLALQDYGFKFVPLLNNFGQLRLVNLCGNPFYDLKNMAALFSQKNIFELNISNCYISHLDLEASKCFIQIVSICNNPLDAQTVVTFFVMERLLRLRLDEHGTDLKYEGYDNIKFIECDVQKTKSLVPFIKLEVDPEEEKEYQRQSHYKNGSDFYKKSNEYRHGRNMCKPAVDRLRNHKQALESQRNKLALAFKAFNQCRITVKHELE